MHENMHPRSVSFSVCISQLYGFKLQTRVQSNPLIIVHKHISHLRCTRLSREGGGSHTCSCTARARLIRIGALDAVPQLAQYTYSIRTARRSRGRVPCTASSQDHMTLRIAGLITRQWKNGHNCACTSPLVRESQNAASATDRSGADPP